MTFLVVIYLAMLIIPPEVMSLHYTLLSRLWRWCE
jgi:hypothetical protein